MFKNLEKFWEFGGCRVAIAAICAHSVSISIGVCQGYSAILLPQLQHSVKFSELTKDQTSWIASLGAIATPIGSFLSGILAEYYGRRRSIQISSIPFILGWVCLGLAQDVNWLYAGRIITGIAAGMSTACYTYVSEISSPESRGFLQSLGPICASFGILLTYTLGYYIKWTTVSFISISFALFSTITIQFLPESPGYFLKHDKLSKAFDVLMWFRRNNAIAQQEIDRFQENQRINDTKNSKFSELMLSPQSVKPFFILVVLFLLQEFSGIYTLLFYAVDFFQETEPSMNENIASIIVGAIRFSMSIMASFLINNFGRKTLCTFSSAGMTVTMIVVAAYVKYYEVYSEEVKILNYLPLGGIMLNVVFSMIGMLPLPWILVGELFPLQVRPIMSGLVICLAQIFVFICVKIYNDMNEALHFSGTLMVFATASAISIAFCKFILVETRNKSLEEIEAYFRGNKHSNEDNKLSGIDNTAYDVTPVIEVERTKEVPRIMVTI